MINFNPELTQDQARYIINEVFPKAGYRINHDTLVPWRNAHNLAFREQVSIPGCSCEYIQIYNVWHSRLHQYGKQIEDIAYPPAPIQTGTTGKSDGKPKNTGKAGRKPKASSGLTD